MADRMIEDLEEQLDAIAVCIRSEGLPVFLQSAWPDLPDILTESATQLRRLRKMFEEAAPSTCTRNKVRELVARVAFLEGLVNGDVVTIRRDTGWAKRALL